MTFTRALRMGLAAMLLHGASHVPFAQAQFAPPTVGGKFNSESGFYTEDRLTIPVRTSVAENVSRLVLEWPMRVGYTVTRPSPGMLEIKFERLANIDTSGAQLAPATNFGKIDTVSPLDRPLTLRLTIPEKAEYRAYNLGYKIVIDVNDVPGETRGTGFAKQPDAAKPVATAISPGSVALLTQNTQSTAQQKPVILEWTSTKNFPVAAFVRNNSVYFATNLEDESFAPRVRDGDITEAMITRLPNTKGTVYRLDLPFDPSASNMALEAEGGEQIWRFRITPAKPPSTEPAPFTLQKEDGKSALLISLKDVTQTMDFTDPKTGETLTAVLAPTSWRKIARPYRTPDLEIIPGAAGFAIKTLNDTLAVTVKDGEIKLESPTGLTLTQERVAGSPVSTSIAAPAPDVSTDQPLASRAGRRVFYFDRWLVGLPNDYTEARQQLEQQLNAAVPDRKPEMMIQLAKFHLANSFGPEALGYLTLAQMLVPALAQDPEYRALRGASLSLMGDGDAGLRALQDPALDGIPEIGIWRAFAAAQMYNWDGAFAFMPTDFSVLGFYPKRLQSRLAITIAETMLRSGRAKEAENLLGTLVAHGAKLSAHEEAASYYLLGESKRLQKQNVLAIQLWNKAEASNDQLYRVKATLAKTILQLQERAVKPEEAIERLERLRFAWRGDGLETQIAQILGRLYLTNKKWDQAFELMRNAAGFAEGTEEGNAITSAMTQAFAQVFTNPPADLKPTEAISLYDRFPELTPPGEEGKAVLRSLAKFLLQVDLLDRAALTYEKIIPQDTNAVEILNDGLQLSAVRLLARQPDKALAALNLPQVAGAKGTAQQMRQKTLLRARALADLRRTDEALKLLNSLPVGNDALSLVADTAWQAARWDLAANALGALLARTDTKRANLTQEQIGLITNRAVALNLANKNTELAAMRTLYMPKLLDETTKRQFDVMTRPAGQSTLADRQTLLGMVDEVDLYGSFLQEAKKPVAPTPAPAAAAQPAPGVSTQPPQAANVAPAEPAAPATE